MLSPVLAAWFVEASGVSPGRLPLAWWPLLLLAVGAATLVLGSFVPARGLRPDLGCSPCAVMALATVLGAAMVFSTFGSQLVAPALAASVAGFGVVQRMGDSAQCRRR